MRKMLTLLCVMLILICPLCMVGCVDETAPPPASNNTQTETPNTLDKEETTKQYKDVSEMSAAEQKALGKQLWAITPALYDEDQVDSLGKILQLQQSEVSDCKTKVAEAEQGVIDAKNARGVKRVNPETGRMEIMPDQDKIDAAQLKLDKANIALNKAQLDWEEYYEYFVKGLVCYAYKIVIDALDGTATNSMLMLKLITPSLKFQRFTGKSDNNIIRDGIVKQIKELSGIDISV